MSENDNQTILNCKTRYVSVYRRSPIPNQQTNEFKTCELDLLQPFPLNFLTMFLSWIISSFPSCILSIPTLVCR